MKRWLIFTFISVWSIQCAHRRSSGDSQSVTVATRPEDVIVPSQALASYTVEAMGDVEGNWLKVSTWLANSKLLKPSKTAPDDETQYEMEGNYGTFVYLGDSVDNGIDNQKVLRFLTSLKKRYPSRVVLILGNRDINKLRFLWELKAAALKLDDPTTMFSLDRFRLTDWKNEFPQYLAGTLPKPPAGALPKPITVDGVVTAYSNGQNVDADKVLKAKFLLART